MDAVQVGPLFTQPNHSDEPTAMSGDTEINEEDNDAKIKLQQELVCTPYSFNP